MEKEDITFSTVLIQLLSGIVVKEAAPGELEYHPFSAVSHQ